MGSEAAPCWGGGRNTYCCDEGPHYISAEVQVGVKAGWTKNDGYDDEEDNEEIIGYGTHYDDDILVKKEEDLRDDEDISRELAIVDVQEDTSVALAKTKGSTSARIAYNKVM